VNLPGSGWRTKALKNIPPKARQHLRNRTRRRPRSHCTAEKRDELAALHRHSITSSARASSDGGTVTPRGDFASRLERAIERSRRPKMIEAQAIEGPNEP
jgi:hypothetical protein